MENESNDKVVFGAFVRAQKKFGPALKSSSNPHFRSKYASLDAVIDAVIDGLHSEGFALTQFTEDNHEGAFVRTVLLHESGGLLTLGELFMPAVKNDPQGFGSALTYCRRYSLLSAMGIAPEDDDGNAASKTPVKRVSATLGELEKLSDERQAIVLAVAEAVHERFNAGDLIGAYGEYIGIEDDNEKIALWSKLDSKARSAIKKYGEELKKAEANHGA